MEDTIRSLEGQRLDAENNFNYEEAERLKNTITEIKI